MRSCRGSSTVSSTRRASIPGLQNLQTDLRLNTPEVRVQINRDKISDIGVNVDTSAARWKRCSAAAR